MKRLASLFGILGLFVSIPEAPAQVVPVYHLCGAYQHWCGYPNVGTCCSAYAVCCRKPGHTPHCGFGKNPCR